MGKTTSRKRTGGGMAQERPHVLVVDARDQTVESVLGEGWTITLRNGRGGEIHVTHGIAPGEDIPRHWKGGDTINAWLKNPDGKAGRIGAMRLRQARGAWDAIKLAEDFGAIRDRLFPAREEPFAMVLRRGGRAVMEAWARVPKPFRWVAALIVGAVIVAGFWRVAA